VTDHAEEWDVTAIVRRFNRSYTQRIGVLAESYLGTGRSLGPSRVLWEIAADGTAVSDLRRRLDLDSGYLSRLLGALADDGLVTLVADASDRRQRIVRLTAAGRRRRQRLEERSQALAAQLVAPLTPGQRHELAAALATAERLLRAATVAVDTVAPDSPVAQRALARYFDELDARFPGGFDASDPGASHHEDAMRPPHGGFVVLRTDDDVVGCGALQRIDDVTAEIKRMWIDPAWRGLGLGRRLLSSLEELGRAQGRHRIVLDTNATLREAIALYERSGYRSTDRYNDNPYAQRWFEKELRADASAVTSPASASPRERAGAAPSRSGRAASRPG
jgi:DNA-binding MarR family transcriptional regulator/GNAT superfamily N-acetyltransferase